MPSRHTGAAEVQLYPWSVPAALPPGKRPGTHSTEGLVGLGDSLDGSGKCHPHVGSNPGPSSP
jgi:hypothetical protein